MGSQIMRATAVENTCRYTKQLAYDSSNNLEYLGIAKIGSATSGALWQIRRFTWSSNDLVTIEWTDGDFEFDNIWDNRASLSYS